MADIVSGGEQVQSDSVVLRKKDGAVVDTDYWSGFREMMCDT